MNIITENQKSILIIAGEASGDTHGAGLVRELRKKNSDLQFFGIGGDQMMKEGVKTIRHVREMSFLGFSEVVKHLPFVRQVFREMVTLLKERNPSLVLLIDYPGFNLRFAKASKKHGIPVLYYISPQVWAWGRGRVKKIARRIDRMVVIFPFEEHIYREADVDVQFVGHPLKDVVRVKNLREEFFKEQGLDPSKPVVGLVPGSRSQEIRNLLPEMIKACNLLQEKIPNLQPILGFAPMLSNNVYEPFLKKDETIRTVRNKTYEVMAHSDVVMVASGTATLETAILGTPLVILYKMSHPSFLLGKALIRVKHIGLVNIVAGEKIVPELIQGNVKADRIAEEVSSLLTNGERIKRMKKDLKLVSRRLGKKGATKRAADAVLEFLKNSDYSC